MSTCKRSNFNDISRTNRILQYITHTALGILVGATLQKKTYTVNVAIPSGRTKRRVSAYITSLWVANQFTATRMGM